MKRFLIVTALLAAVCGSADAARGRKVCRKRTVCRSVRVERTMVRQRCVNKCDAPKCEKPAESDQACKDGSCSIAQRVAIRKATYMARYRITGHPNMHWNSEIPGYCFEGTGWSSGGTPGTCTPDFNCNLAGDATAYSSAGVAYRVRIWTR